MPYTKNARCLNMGIPPFVAITMNAAHENHHEIFVPMTLKFRVRHPTNVPMNRG